MQSITLIINYPLVYNVSKNYAINSPRRYVKLLCVLNQMSYTYSLKIFIFNKNYTEKMPQRAK